MLLFNNQLLKLLLKTLFDKMTCLSSCFSNYLWCETGSGLRQRDRQLNEEADRKSHLGLSFRCFVLAVVWSAATAISFDWGINPPRGFSRKCPQQHCWTGLKCLTCFQENMMNQSERSWSSERICVLQVSVGEPEQTRPEALSVLCS